MTGGLVRHGGKLPGACVALLIGLVSGWGCVEDRPEIRERTGPPQAEQNEIVPVGGYEILAGTWQTRRTDEVKGAQELPLLLEVDRDVISGGAPSHAVRVRCQASHRTCVGTWSDNIGHGALTWIFSTDFQGFTGSYQGTSDGTDVGKTTWTGKKQ